MQVTDTGGIRITVRPYSIRARAPRSAGCGGPAVAVQLRAAAAALRRRPARGRLQAPSLGVDVNVILTCPCIFCMENH